MNDRDQARRGSGVTHAGAGDAPMVGQARRGSKGDHMGDQTGGGFGPDAGPERLPVELEAFRGLLSPDVLAAAARRARDLGVGGDQVLVAQGHVTPRQAAQCLADHLGLELAQPEHLHLPPDAATLKALLRTGAVPEMLADGRTRFNLAAEGREVRHLARALKADTTLHHRVRLLAPADLRALVMARASRALTRDAAFHLRDTKPEASAGTLSQPFVTTMLGLAIATPLLAALLVPLMLGQPVTSGFLILQFVLSLVFLFWITLRLAGCLYDAEWPRHPSEESCEAGERGAADDRALPVYSILVPLYREAAVVPQLVEALGALDYPPEKLDIKLVVEADDTATRAAIASTALPACMEEVAVADIGPRTKPKALDMALAFTRGAYVCIFDAEDLPEPDQLRRALAAFRGQPEVGCVQARLCVDNGDESWISGQFAAEYAAQFDVLLPLLNALELPILLGGTSNHFRRDVLEKVGAWDPFNVTEDADLGIRLARAGWRTRVIAASTFEEAPLTWRAWLGQRTRWMKGWAQTILVHGRQPGALVRQLGLRDTLVLALLTVGPFAAALAHPFFLLLLLYDLSQGVVGLPCETSLEVVVSGLSYCTLLVGTLGAAFAVMMGWRRRGQSVRWRVVMTIPVYWVLASVATFNALVDLVWRPFYWKKTEHGLSRRRGRPGLGVALQK
ncbi:glycosyltransferase family 2 protein [Xanthobacter sp. TB0139]|uniref:glycosyltransferase family 2 protein n=1 Tax=Xanthobacter sp. TB0139 TaxID=3459178 RepID=UPI004039B9A4